jgi:hypothetical protein
MYVVYYEISCSLCNAYTGMFRYFDLQTFVHNNDENNNNIHRFYGLVVRVPCYRSRGPGSIPGTTRFSEK